MRQQIKNVENNLNDINKKYLDNNFNSKSKEILELNNKFNNLVKDIERLEKNDKNNKNKEDTNKEEINKLSKNIKELKSEIDNNDKININENEINKLKEENENLINKVNKLEEEINNLKKYHESINYNDENKNNGMEIEEKIIDNNNNLNHNNNNNNNYNNNNPNYQFNPFFFKSNGMNLQRVAQNNGFINNFVADNIINVFFRIDGKNKLNIPAYPNDKLKDLFSLALKRNNFTDIGIDGFKFFLGVRNISSNFISNDPISSLNLMDNCIIEVHT